MSAPHTHEKPSMGDKLKGEAERLQGKMQHNPEKVAEGTALKGHEDKAEAVLRTGNTDASEAAKDVHKEEKHADGHHDAPQTTPAVQHDAAVGRGAIN